MWLKNLRTIFNFTIAMILFPTFMRHHHHLHYNRHHHLPVVSSHTSALIRVTVIQDTHVMQVTIGMALVTVNVCNYAVTLVSMRSTLTMMTVGARYTTSLVQV